MFQFCDAPTRNGTEDRLVLDGTTDLDRAVADVVAAPDAAFAVLSSGVAAEVLGSEWGAELVAMAERHGVDAASRVASSDRSDTERIAALEFLRLAEPWSRAHVDALIALHRDAGDDAAAAAAERVWFADD